jgi:hypothetical protein
MMMQVAKQMESVSLVELKRLAEKLLPRTSALRMLILSEPDFLQRNVALAKIEIFVKLLYHELC